MFDDHIIQPLQLFFGVEVDNELAAFLASEKIYLGAEGSAEGGLQGCGLWARLLGALAPA